MAARVYALRMVSIAVVLAAEGLNTMYWTATPPDGWTIDSGYRDEIDAIHAAEKLSAVFQAPIRIELLPTQEHETPADAPEFRPGHVFRAERWCVLVPNGA